MKIKILGTRGQVETSKPWHSRHSGLLVDEKLLFDVGEEEFLNYNPEAVFFTHFHPDHAYFIEDDESVSLPVPVFGPEENDLLEDVNILSDKAEIGDYTITPIPTIHSLKVKSQGYTIEKEETRIFYSADMIWIVKDYHHELENLNAVITEASFFRKDGMVRRDSETGKIYGHTGVPDLVNLFSRFTGRIIFMHYGNWFLRDVLAGRKKIKKLGDRGLKLHLARDGEVFQID